MITRTITSTGCVVYIQDDAHSPAPAIRVRVNREPEWPILGAIHHPDHWTITLSGTVVHPNTYDQAVEIIKNYQLEEIRYFNGPQWEEARDIVLTWMETEAAIDAVLSRTK